MNERPSPRRRARRSVVVAVAALAIGTTAVAVVGPLRPEGATAGTATVGTGTPAAISRAPAAPSAPDASALEATPAAAPPPIAPEPPAGRRRPPRPAPAILDPRHPRAFFFRQSERIAWGRELREETYRSWVDEFGRLQGVAYKLDRNELKNIGPPATVAMERFKAEHPEQLAIWHYNGLSRDPAARTPEYFAGHWLFYNGARIVGEVRAEDGESELVVDRPELFDTDIGRYGGETDPLAMCRLGPDGRPDWSVAEELQLVSIDLAKRTLRVRRAQLGTAPLAVPEGRGYVAAHVARGPWSPDGPLLWMYNHALTCPRDATGRRCLEVHADELGARLAPGGEMASADAVLFDVLMHHPYPSMWVDAGAVRDVDCDADGEPDGGMVGGRQVFGLGVIELLRRLRAQLGDEILLIGAHFTELHNRAFEVLNGGQAEGFPKYDDPQLSGWSSGWNRLGYWHEHARRPALNVVVHKFSKWNMGAAREARERGILLKEGTMPTEIGATRLVLASAVIHEAAVTYLNLPGGASHVRGSEREVVGLLPIWDELWNGADQEVGWLGAPLAPAVHASDRAARTPLLDRVAGERSRTSRAGPAVVLYGDETLARTIVRVRDVAVGDGSVMVHLRARGEPMDGYPDSVPRAVDVVVEDGDALLLSEREPPRRGLEFRDGSTMRGLPRHGTGAWFTLLEREVGGVSRSAYFVSPPFGERTGRIWWERDVRVPDGGVLRFSTCGSPSAAHSDGVVQLVEVADLDAGTPAEVVFQRTTRTFAWVDHEIDLSRFAGRRVRLRFVADCGPADDPRSDGAHWGDVRVVRPGRADQPDLDRAVQSSLLGTRPFASRFLFDGLHAGLVDVVLRFEGAEPVTLEELSLTAGPEWVYREFEHGLVLANPSLSPVEIDLTDELPGRRYRRIRGTPEQDPTTNDGSPVDGPVRLGPRDGLFLVRVD